MSPGHCHGVAPGAGPSAESWPRGACGPQGRPGPGWLQRTGRPAADRPLSRPTVGRLHPGNRPADPVPAAGPGSPLVVLAPVLHRGKCPEPKVTQGPQARESETVTRTSLKGSRGRCSYKGDQGGVGSRGSVGGQSLGVVRAGVRRSVGTASPWPRDCSAEDAVNRVSDVPTSRVQSCTSRWASTATLALAAGPPT